MNETMLEELKNEIRKIQYDINLCKEALYNIRDKFEIPFDNISAQLEGILIKSEQIRNKIKEQMKRNKNDKI
jgi:hypothetical protein